MRKTDFHQELNTGSVTGNPVHQLLSPQFPDKPLPLIFHSIYSHMNPVFGFPLHTFLKEGESIGILCCFSKKQERGGTMCCYKEWSHC